MGGLKWVRPFLAGQYFAHCGRHPTGKNERNHFCLDCVEGPICNLGLQREHAGHNTLQIRRASHMDAVRVCDIQKFAEVSDIQTYTINGAKIVFLLSRPQYKITKGALHWCKCCNRTLTDPTSFCSISCKLTGEKLDPSIRLALDGHISGFYDEDFCENLGRTCSDEWEMNYRVNLKRTFADCGKTELPLKKRKIHIPTDGIRSSGYGYESDNGSPRSPISVLMPRIEIPSPLSPQHSGIEHRFPSPLRLAGTPESPCTPANVDSFSFRTRQRKGFPHRSPLQ